MISVKFGIGMRPLCTHWPQSSPRLLRGFNEQLTNNNRVLMLTLPISIRLAQSHTPPSLYDVELSKQPIENVQSYSAVPAQPSRPCCSYCAYLQAECPLLKSVRRNTYLKQGLSPQKKPEPCARLSRINESQSFQNGRYKSELLAYLKFHEGRPGCSSGRFKETTPEP